MRTSRTIIGQLLAHAQADTPLECCGLLAADNTGDIARAYPASNAARSAFRYEIDGLDQWRLEERIARDGLTLAGIYHSHTRDRPYPSEMDVTAWFWPNLLCVIIGLDPPAVQAYRIQGDRVVAVPVDVTVPIPDRG